MINSGKLILKGWGEMTDDVMKKVESLLFDDEKPKEPEIITKKIEEEPETIEELEVTKEPEKPKSVKTTRKGISMDFIEIFFDGHMEISGTKIKTVPGSEIETGNLKFVFEDNSVKVYEI